VIPRTPHISRSSVFKERTSVIGHLSSVVCYRRPTTDDQ